MKKMMLFLQAFLLIFLIGNYGLAQSDQPEKKGYEDYIEFLKINRDVLKYNTYGLIESVDEIVIKIYCDKESQQQVIKSLGDFQYRTYDTKEFSEDQIVISIFFSRTQQVEPAEPKEETPTMVSEPSGTTLTIPPKDEAVEVKKTEQEEKKEVKCPRRVKVQVRPVTPQVFNQYRHYEKSLVYDQDIELRTQITAKVKEVSVNQGDRVQEGQELVRLDSTAIEREIESIQELLKKWKEILFKRQNWKERNPRAEQQAEQRIEEAEVLLAEKMDELSSTLIKAPFDGQITAVVSQGEPLEKGAIVLRLVTDHLMKVVIDPQDRQLFEAGANINVFPIDSETGVMGTVIQSPEETKIVLPNDDRRLSPGLKVRFRVLFKTHSEAMVALEREVLQDEQGHYVYVVEDRRAARRNIQVVAVEDGKVLIGAGIAMGDEVIVSGFECLKDQKKIKIMVWDEEKGKLRARRKKEEIPVKKVEPEVVEVPEVPVEKVEKKKNFWRLAGGLGAFLNLGSVFTDVYGTFVPSGFLTASFVYREKIEIFVTAVYATGKGASTGLEEEVTLSMIPIYIGGKFYLKKIKKFYPFVGAALTRYNTKESFSAADEYHSDTNWRSNFGGSAFAGLYWPISSKLDLMVALHYDYSQVPFDDSDVNVDLSGFRLLVGISYPLGRR